RATEIWPDAIVVPDRREIPRHPNTADVHARENRGAHDREQRHRFGRTIDRCPPFLAQQIQDCGYQCTGVSDTDPENEVRDVPRPSVRNVISPHTDAGGNLVTETEQTEHRDRAGNGETKPPPTRCAILNNARESLGEPTEIAPIQH